MRRSVILRTQKWGRAVAPAGPVTPKELASMPRHATTTDCPYCGTEHRASPAALRKGKDRFCSRKCFNAYRRRPAEERFWAKVDKNGPPHPILGTPCWLWTAARSHRNYGLWSPYSNTAPQIGAHRYAFHLAYPDVPLPDQIEVCHRCDNPPCVRPDHLFLGTPSDNALDSSRKGRSRAGILNIKAKLTEGDVLEIRALDAVGSVEIDKLAAEKGVTGDAIRAVIRRRTWRHLP